MVSSRETKEINLTSVSNTYTLTEASKIAKYQEKLPSNERSKWYDPKTGCRIYFINNK